MLEPHNQSRLAAKPQTSATLPEDLLRDQRLRLQLLYVVGVFLWSITMAMDLYIAPNGDRGPYAALIEGLGAALAAATACYVRFARCSDRTTVEIGVVLMLPHALTIALLNSWVQQPLSIRPLSGNTILILFFGMLAPARPSKMLAAAVAAATMDPLGVWIAHLRGLTVPSPVMAFLLFYPNYVCALLTVAPARVLYRLGRQIREARALGSYELIERLGEGGMGEVWLARHRLLARNAAIKLIRPDMLIDRQHQVRAEMQRFEREAQATAALTSPHTIRVFDFGLSDDGAFYYVMELLDGRDLESLVKEFGPLPPARALHIVKQVCRSLAEAHGAGLIHRDIKPANIYLCRMGIEYDFVKVLDFGLVRHEDRTNASTLITAGQTAIGTPAYMAPETILGNPELDRRVDLYAVGCVAYFLLTGERVFDAPSPMKVLMQHVHDQPVPPSQRSEHPIPRAVDDLVMACLQKDPSRRPHSAEMLFQLASRALRGDTWDEETAREWWDAHLPEMTAPAARVPRLGAALAV